MPFAIADTPAPQAQRIISTDSSSTNLIIALGLSEQLVAIDVTSTAPPGKTLPSVGYHRNLSAEGMLSLAPTLVIGNEHMAPQATVNALQQAGVILVRLVTPLSITQLKANIKQLASALGATANGKDYLANLDEKINRLNLPAHRSQQSLFLLNANGNTLRAAGRGTGGAAFLELLGSQNAVQFEKYRNLSAEALIAMAPDIVVVASTEPQTSIKDIIHSSPALLQTPAAASGKIFVVDGGALVAGMSSAALDEALRINQQLQLADVTP
jgi:iron complex transport system substrate-binding protein